VRNNNTVMSSEDNTLIKTYGNLKDFLSKYLSRNSLLKIEKIGIGRLSVKVAHSQFGRMPCRKQ